MTPLVVYCWRSGEIALGYAVPAGAVPIAEIITLGDLEVLQACARLAHDGKTLLVPGAPEADDDDAAVDAVLVFGSLLRARLKQRRSA